MSEHLNISGVLPHLAVKADHFPQRTETGIGALLPWADRLWLVTYVAHKAGSGGGTGLFSIDDTMTMVKHPASVVGTYANRLVHHESSQAIIGPHIIDSQGNVRTFTDLVDYRLTATCRHLDDPANKVYFLGMEGELFEADVHSLKVTKLAELTELLYTSGKGPAHFKAGYSHHGRLVVANNSYYPKDFLDPDDCDGRLAEWDGKEWRVIERTQFNTVNGRLHGTDGLGAAIYAVGQDRASAVLKTWLPDTGWQTWRLPKATHTQDHAWTTEWPRLREVESERWLLNASGMFYELAAMTYGNRLWGVRPVCSHLRIIGDFCSWNGLLVMAGDQTTPIGDSNPECGQPQANLWFGKTDDLWQWGKPTGWGGPWYEDEVEADVPSDPFLMTGFDQKCLHLSHDAGLPVTFRLEVNVCGDGRWHTCDSFTTDDYHCHVFPAGFSAHWIRLLADRDCTATAQLHYT